MGYYIIKFIIYNIKLNQIPLVLVDVIKENFHPLFKHATKLIIWIFGKLARLRYHFKLELKTILTEYIIHDSSIYKSDSHWVVNQFMQQKPTRITSMKEKK